MTSFGCRSGVHWMRDGTAPSIDWAIARASTVFAVPGHVLEEHVPAARERAQDEPDLLGLAVDDRLDVLAQAAWRSPAARATRPSASTSTEALTTGG